MDEVTKGYRIRIADDEIITKDIAALVEMARSGRIGRATLVSPPGKTAFVRADTIAQVKAVLRTDPWSAWDAEEAVDMLDDFAPPPLRQSLTDPPPPRPSDDRVAELPASAMLPIEEPAQQQTPASVERTAPPRPMPVRRPPAKIIAFPDSGRTNTSGPHALDRVLRDPASRIEPPTKRGGINWFRLGLVGLVCVLGMLLWVWHVNATVNPKRVRTSPSVEAVVTPVQNPASIEPKAPSPYERLEDELRTQLMEGILDIPSEEGFEDALHIEMRRVRLDVAWVRVRIESWAGRNQDLPQTVAVQIRLGGREGELDRDLAAVGLVMGKYIQHYGLETSTLSVLIEDDNGAVRKVEMNSQSARRFFTHRLTLERFLSAAFRGE